MQNLEASSHLKRHRVLILGSVIPMEGSGGGCLALHRHFVERGDYEIAIASNRKSPSADISFLQLNDSRIKARLRRTRLCRLIQNVDYFANWLTLPKALIEFAARFQPDIIFSVVDDWHIGLATQLSRKLSVPLIINFQDLFALSNFTEAALRPYKMTKTILLHRYRRLNSLANNVLHTSEGMRRFFGSHPEAKVLYPIGGQLQARQPVKTAPTERIQLLYAGNCYGAYGRMLRQLSFYLLEHASDIDLHIYTQGNDWTSDEVQKLRAEGILRGSLPFHELTSRLEAADAFLTVMSFENAEQTFVSTSFTTKWLDYAPFGKPIFAWGPENSSAAVFAKEFHAGCAITSNTPASVRSAVETAAAGPGWARLAAGANAAAMDQLNPEKVHAVLVEAVAETIDQCSH